MKHESGGADEAAVIAHARRGDMAAFATLVERYQPPVYNLAYRMLGDAPKPRTPRRRRSCGRTAGWGATSQPASLRHGC